jgi:hypothetical protein
MLVVRNHHEALCLEKPITHLYEEGVMVAQLPIDNLNTCCAWKDEKQGWSCAAIDDHKWCSLQRHLV